MAQSLEGMDLIDRVREISNRIRKRIDNVETEEATEHALVMPFIYQVLGYNVFDPTEVVPEFTADVGTKKGEKVDYAIMSEHPGSHRFLSALRLPVSTGNQAREVLEKEDLIRQGDDGRWTLVDPVVSAYLRRL